MGFGAMMLMPGGFVDVSFGSDRSLIGPESKALVKGRQHGVPK